MTRKTTAPTELLLHALFLFLPGSCPPSRFVSGTTATRKTTRREWSWIVRTYLMSHYSNLLKQFFEKTGLYSCFLLPLLTSSACLMVGRITTVGIVLSGMAWASISSSLRLKSRKEFFPDSAYFPTYINGSIEEFLQFEAFLLKTKKAPSPGVSVQLPASCCFEKSRK